MSVYLKACVYETGVFINAGNNVKDTFLAENGPDECASHCALTSGCVGWTFKISDSKCWLKSDDSEKSQARNWITGTKSCGFRSKYS